MRIIEILLKKSNKNTDMISNQVKKDIDLLKKEIKHYADLLKDPKTTPRGAEYLKTQIKDKYEQIRNLGPKVDIISEAVTKLPITNDDFDSLKKIMENPIPATLALAYICDIIEDDELTSQILSIEGTHPNRDVRPLIAGWIDRVMPDQKYRFTGEPRHLGPREGQVSVIHGYDPKSFRSEPKVVDGNAFGRF
jgi:hypothetical protein